MKDNNANLATPVHFVPAQPALCIPGAFATGTLEEAWADCLLQGIWICMHNNFFELYTVRGPTVKVEAEGE